MHATRGILTSLLAGLLLPGCGGADSENSENSENTGNGEDTVDQGEIDYQGPPLVRCELAGDDVVVAVEVPSGGWSFEHGETQIDGTTATVGLKLTEPGEGEAVTTALETHELRVPLVGAARSVRVRIARWIRGVEYVQPPPQQLAQVLKR